ncbi:MAG: CAAX prenyl protease-related protein [Chthoniobacterales bacterium]
MSDPTPPAAKLQPASTRSLYAYCLPFALFMLGLAAVSVVKMLAPDSDTFLLANPAYWVYPLQSLLCAGALIYFWRDYDFGSQKSLPFAIGVGIIVLFVWISPEAFFGFEDRLEGFDPTVFDESAGLYWGTVLARFFRLVIIVPLIEEIFWRGFLQRYLIKENFTDVPFGQYTHLSFWGVVVAFTLVHQPADYLGAAITGALFGWIAIRTKSLLCCVVAHAVTNLILGFYIMWTQQWGYW